MQRFLKNHWAGTIGLLITSGVLFCAVFALWIAPHDPFHQDLERTLLPPVWEDGGDSNHLLGTDPLGRDILSRIIYGSRVSLIVSFAGVLVAVVTGLLLGTISGFYGGRADSIIMRLVDVKLSFPFILLAIFIVAVLGPGLVNLILVAGITTGVSLSRIIRGEVLSVREQNYIEAIRSVGASDLRIIFKHIIPNIVNVVIVAAAIEMGQLILLESSISFLGLGMPAEVPTWGSMLSDSRNLLMTQPWATVLPGLAIMLTVLGINLLGDGLRDCLNPRREAKGTME